MADERDRRSQRRYERERTARLEAERIAEDAIAALSVVNRSLDQRVVERTAELEEALVRLEAADRAKGVFLRGLAHEMSTPMHAVLGFVELVGDRTDDPEIRRSAAQAGAAATRLHSAMRTLLEFAAASTGELVVTPTPVRLGDWADSVSARWAPTALRRGTLLITEVLPDPSMVAETDAARLDQMVDALVDNALRFGGGQVTVTATLRDEPRPVLELAVSDLGPGLPDELGDRAFEPFVRGDHAVDGFGVGLTLVREVAQALGGSVVVDAAYTDGARVLVRVPIGRAPSVSP